MSQQKEQTVQNKGRQGSPMMMSPMRPGGAFWRSWKRTGRETEKLQKDIKKAVALC
jgi:hypothetical protein